MIKVRRNTDDIYSLASFNSTGGDELHRQILRARTFCSPPRAASEIASLQESLLSVAVVISRLRSPVLPESKLPSLFWQVYANFWLSFGAISSVVERLLHTQEVAGSNPASRIYATGKQRPSYQLFHRVLKYGAKHYHWGLFVWFYPI